LIVKYHVFVKFWKEPEGDEDIRDTDDGDESEDTDLFSESEELVQENQRRDNSDIDANEAASTSRKGSRRRQSPNRYRDEFSDPNNRASSSSSLPLTGDLTKASKTNHVKKSTKPPKKPAPKKQCKQKTEGLRSILTVSESPQAISTPSREASSQLSSSSSSFSSTSFVVKQPKPTYLKQEPHSMPVSKLTATDQSGLLTPMITPPNTRVASNSSMSVKTELFGVSKIESSTKIDCDYLWKYINDRELGALDSDALMKYLRSLGIGDDIMFSFFMQTTDMHSQEMNTMLDFLKPLPRKVFVSYLQSNSKS
jgi:hypothetical protein